MRVYYVHNIDGKWLFWGRVFIQTLKIEKMLQKDGCWKEGDWMTSGTYKIVDIYDPVYQETFTRHEAPPGRQFRLTWANRRARPNAVDFPRRVADQVVRVKSLVWLARETVEVPKYASR